MIIVTATLSFETEADRDDAVASTAGVQKATRDDEEGCLAYCFGAACPCGNDDPEAGCANSTGVGGFSDIPPLKICTGR